MIQTVNALIVEDNLHAQQVLKHTLSHSDKTKFVPHFVQTDLAAKEKLKKMAQEIRQDPEFRPTIILLDLFLPKDFGSEATPDTGLKLCSWIKNHPDLKHIPVIFLSNAPEKDYKEQVIKSYASDFIEKPFQEEQLFSRLSTILFNQLAMIEKYNPNLPEAANLPDLEDITTDALSFTEKVNHIILENIAAPDFNREKLAEKMGLCVRSLGSRLDIAPAQYINRYKVEYGAMLIEKGLKPKEVAKLCGFGQQAFRKQFKKYKDISPSRYQKTKQQAA